MASIEERFVAFIEGSTADKDTTVRRFALPVLRDAAATESDLCFIVEICVRRAACDDVLAREFLRLMQDPQQPLSVRSGALVALEASVRVVCYDFPDDENPISQAVHDAIIEAARRLVDDGSAPARLRQFALETWASFDVLSEEERAPIVRRAWALDDRGWKLSAARSMQFLHGLDEEALQAMASEDEELRAAGIIAAGHRGLPEAWPMVSELLVSPSTTKPLLLAALSVAWNIEPDESQQLIAPHATSADPDLAEAADQALELAVSSSFTLDLAHENLVTAGKPGLGRSGKTTLPS